MAVAVVLVRLRSILHDIVLYQRSSSNNGPEDLKTGYKS